MVKDYLLNKIERTTSIKPPSTRNYIPGVEALWQALRKLLTFHSEQLP
jgi:hypothetical protein